MCLTRITDRNPKRDGHGWKLFCSCRGNLRTPFYNKETPTGKWLRANQATLAAHGPKKWADDRYFYTLPTYPSGFHFFKTRREARMALSADPYRGHATKIVKVRYRHAQVEGLQMGLRVIVAKEIYVEASDAE